MLCMCINNWGHRDLHHVARGGVSKFVWLQLQNPYRDHQSILTHKINIVLELQS